MAAKKEAKGITAKEHVMAWIRGIHNPEETIEQFKGMKPSFMEGIKSALLLGAILGILNSLAVLIGGDTLVDAFLWFIAYLLITPITALTFAAFMKGASALMKGKGTYSEHVGIIGILLGMVTIASMPFAIGSIISSVITALSTSDAAIIISMLIEVVGIIMTAILSMMLFVESCAIFAANEKVSLMKAALTVGIAISIAMAAFFVVLIIAALMIVGPAALAA